MPDAASKLFCRFMLVLALLPWIPITLLVLRDNAREKQAEALTRKYDADAVALDARLIVVLDKVAELKAELEKRRNGK